VKRRPIDPSRMTLPVFQTWEEEGFLLTCGDLASGTYNTMTVGWGAFGVMWKKPMALVVVRPTRYTFSYMEEHREFTICGFGGRHREALAFCGSHSGRDVDKIARTGLTPVASTRVAAPGFDEAELIVECRGMYSDDFDPARFLADFVESNYPKKDYHRLYLGEVLAVSGTERYLDSR
jgi:flavin reductase (DIM6/NTAB) family NADH-FMN oxidoreductase RutF